MAKPVRLDPFTNIVNVGWNTGAEIICIEFSFLNHRNSGSVPLIQATVKNISGTSKLGNNISDFSLFPGGDTEIVLEPSSTLPPPPIVNPISPDMLKRYIFWLLPAFDENITIGLGESINQGRIGASLGFLNMRQIKRIFLPKHPVSFIFDIDINEGNSATSDHSPPDFFEISAIYSKGRNDFEIETREKTLGGGFSAVQYGNQLKDHPIDGPGAGRTSAGTSIKADGLLLRFTYTFATEFATDSFISEVVPR
jgi:hypothetical protein